MTTTSDSPTVWTTLPQQNVAAPVEKDATEIVSISEAYGQSSATTSLSVTTPYQYNSYPTSTQYAMYTSSNPASYYEQMASNLRAQTTAFPYSLTATPSYFAGAYPVDYTSAAAYQNTYYPRAPYYNPLNTAAAYVSVASSVLGTDAASLTESATSGVSATSSSSGGGFNLKEKKQKPKKKKTGSCSPGDETYARVFIWDLEDITILSRNFLASIAQRFPVYLGATSSISQLMDSVALTSFSDINEVLEGDVTNIDDAVVEEGSMDGGPMDNLRGLDVMRRVAPKYSAFRQFYTDLSSKLPQNEGFKQEQNVFNYELMNHIGMAARETEMCHSAHEISRLSNFQQRWQCAQRCMDLVVKRSAESTDKYANVVLSNDGVVFGAAQLMLSGLSGAVPIENVYSVSKQGKESIFEKIQTRYGKKCSFVCVTASDSAATAKRLSIPVWPLQTDNDLDKLYNAMTNYLLG
ncbi:unnamed protein product [Caenorhabditis sp. 36 PRJEB53466]|nr:unnamed protein product [Caenorhabditis sp. 36 PRJEB53466]